MTTPEEDTLDRLDKLSDLLTQMRDLLEKRVHAQIAAQRQSDLNKISFHAGIDLKTLQGYLDSGVKK